MKKDFLRLCKSSFPSFLVSSTHLPSRCSPFNVHPPPSSSSSSGGGYKALDSQEQFRYGNWFNNCSVLLKMIACSLSWSSRSCCACCSNFFTYSIPALRRILKSNHFALQYYPPKTAQEYQSEGDLSGSYVSLECPPPPGPAKLSDSRRDPQVNSIIYNYSNCPVLKTNYRFLFFSPPHTDPSWEFPEEFLH